MEEKKAIIKIENARCGECYHWMTQQCPREAQGGKPTMSDRKCESFKISHMYELEAEQSQDPSKGDHAPKTMFIKASDLPLNTDHLNHIAKGGEIHVNFPTIGDGKEVVKDLEYFKNEVAKEQGWSSFSFIEIKFSKDLDSGYWEIKNEAKERWYKHQLEEKEIEITKWRESSYSWSDAHICIGAELVNTQQMLEHANATIEEQKKTIDLFNLNEGLKDAEIDKLTQENNTLKQK